ncbi:MAG: SPFH domain-containing protein [Spartobacteria bacterium]
MWRRRGFSARRLTKTGFLILAAGCALNGCVKPYDTPEYAEIDTSETGFLIPLEGDSGSQAKFQSKQYLRDLKGAAKRVQITHRWSQEGRFYWSGRCIPTVRLIKVNRSPVTREWTAENNSGTASKNVAIWIESADSVGFSLGFTCTSFNAEENAAKFLYWYPSGSLDHVMDSEVRGRIQQISAEVAARYPLDALRERKQEISDAVKKDLTQFFLDRGVTVTTLGMFGGMTYENAEIQKSIDNTVIAQQLKVVNEAASTRNGARTIAWNWKRTRPPSGRAGSRPVKPTPRKSPPPRKRSRSAE